MMYKKNLFWKLGHSYTGHKLKSSPIIGARRFRAFFGVSPLVCEKIWELLKYTRPSNCHPKHLLWSLMFLKQYNAEHTSKAILNADEKTIRKWTWCFLNLLSNLDVIIWEKRFQGSVPGQKCFVSLDGVDFKILEPIPFKSKWYSHKFNGPGLRYEIGLCIRTGFIVWAHGGYPCGQYSDLKLARDAYIYFVNTEELTLADKGYKDQKYFILPSENNNIRHKTIMSRHETINKRIKQFKVLSTTFRNSLAKHAICFHSVVNITQIMLESGEPLFSVF